MAKATKKKSRMTARVEIIDAALATEYLEANTQNRSLSAERILQYKDAIVAGKFQVTGESIIFGIDEDGNIVLLDGQHRLEGLVMAGGKHTIEVVVVRGIKTRAMEVIDTGQKRTPGQILRLRNAGEHYVNDLSSTLVFLHRHEKRIANNQQVPMWIKIDLLDRYGDDLRASIKYTYNCNWVRMHAASRAVATGVHYLASQKHTPALANEFFALLNKGEALPKGSPILTLREFLIERKDRRAYLPWVQLYTCYRSAWDAWIQGQDMKAMPTETPEQRNLNWEVQ